MLVKKTLLAVVIILNVLSMASFAMAMPDPFATLTVWPVNTPAGAEGPIITESPADVIIYNVDSHRVLDDVWLMLVINKLAHDNLVSITTNVSLNFLPAYFLEIPGTAAPNEKIPPTGSDSGTTPSLPYAYRPNGWPGMEWNDLYDVGSLRSQLKIPDGESMWYSVGDLDDAIAWIDHGPAGLNHGDPEYFTITVDVGGFGGSWEAMVLALGHTNDYPDNPILNVHSPYTRSTLIVSELGPFLLILAPVSALGLYKIRYKTRKK